MAAKLTPAQALARYEAYTEAADHLENLGWSEDKTELAQGLIAAQHMRRQAQKYLALAHSRRNPDKGS